VRAEREVLESMGTFELVPESQARQGGYNVLHSGWVFAKKPLLTGGVKFKGRVRTVVRVTNGKTVVAEGRGTVELRVETKAFDLAGLAPACGAARADISAAASTARTSTRNAARVTLSKSSDLICRE
jgi:hypothetical protein